MVCFWSRARTHWLTTYNIASFALNTTAATNKWLKRSIENMDLSKCSCNRNAVLPVFSTRPTPCLYGCFLCGRVQHIACYLANNTHLTIYVVWQLVSNELHMLQFGSHQTLGYTTRRQKKRATIATDSCFKVGYVCNVVVLFRTAAATVGSTLHILPHGTLSTLCIANLHSQTCKALRKTHIIIIIHNC